MRTAPALAGLVVLFAIGCGVSDEGAGTEGSGGAGTSALPSSTVATPSPPAFGADDIDNGVLIARGLLREDDAPEGFSARAVARPLADADQNRLQWCGVDLRGEAGAGGGVQTVLADDQIQISAVLTGLADDGATRFLDRFTTLGQSCDRTWTQPRTGLGPGVTLESEVVDAVVLPDLPDSVSGAAFAVVLESESGSSSAVAAVLQSGPFVSAVTVSGPVEADLGLAPDVVGAAAQRLAELSAQFA